MREENRLADIVIEQAIRIHKELGPGMLESTYQEILAYLLRKEGLKVEREVYLPIIFEELKIPKAYRIDLLIENKLVIELKAVETTLPKHKAQVLTYIKLGDYKLGLLINFNEKLLLRGVKRVINSK
jgi:GxxExxY protein